MEITTEIETKYVVKLNRLEAARFLVDPKEVQAEVRTLLRPGDRDDDFEDEDDNGPYDDYDNPETDAYGIAEGYHPARRRHAPVSLVRFLGGLKRSFPLGELIPAITMQQLLSGGNDDADP